MIGIIAILAAAVILVLNPAQLIAQARDSTRASDISSLKMALSLYEEDVSPLSLGTSGTVYVSIPAVNSNCSDIGLPSNYHCVTSANLQKTDGTGWIPVNFNNVSSGSPFSSLPIDPTNTTSTGLYYEYMTDGSNWSISAVPESIKYQSDLAAFGDSTSPSLAGNYPAGWAAVPGNGTFGTTSFSLMKYDAKCASSNGTPLTSPDTGYQTYSNSTTPCVSPYSVVSSPSGYPIANIDQTDAVTYCNNIGAHLMTNNEWQTISWNAQGVSSNWYGGVVGTNYMGRGNSDNTVAEPASPDDTNTDYLTGYSDFTHRRTLALSNGNVVWDLAGNVWEWTNDTIAGTNEPNAGAGVFAWHEFTAITSWGTMTQATAGPSNSAWNSTQGMGQIYSEGETDATTYGFLRGGGWGDGSNAGAETLLLSGSPSSADSSVGFRCAR